MPQGLACHDLDAKVPSWRLCYLLGPDRLFQRITLTRLRTKNSLEAPQKYVTNEDPMYSSNLEEQLEGISH